jgi:hypothetical protein
MSFLGGGMMEYVQRNGSNRKPYNKLTAQIARNTVKKHMMSIKNGGARAADEFIDQFLKNGTGGQRKNSDPNKKTGLESKLLPLIEKNRGKWRNFIIELVGSFDIDSLSTVGVGVVYGGIMTSSVGNIGWASELIVDTKNGDISPEQIKKAAELISSGRNRGSMVWIIRGKDAFSREVLRLYRYNPECVFFIIENRENGMKAWENSDKKELSGLKNIVFVLSGAEQGDISLIAPLGIPYVIDPSLKGSAFGRNDGGISPRVGYDRELLGFIESPAFPLTINSLSEAADIVEYLLSEGKSRQIPRYRI